MLSLVPASATAQAASSAEQAAVAEIAPCIVQGTPEDWDRVTMVIRLEEPLAQTGQVRYFATLVAAPEQPVGYTPCDPSVPARILLDSRKDQQAERRGWTSARLILRRDGSFDLKYDYP